jgi:hypothetical protein
MTGQRDTISDGASLWCLPEVSTLPRGSGWGAGGLPGLQIQSAGVDCVRGGFDSHTLPPARAPLGPPVCVTAIVPRLARDPNPPSAPRQPIPVGGLIVLDMRTQELVGLPGESRRMSPVPYLAVEHIAGTHAERRRVQRLGGAVAQQQSILDGPTMAVLHGTNSHDHIRCVLQFDPYSLVPNSDAIAPIRLLDEVSGKKRRCPLMGDLHAAVKPPAVFVEKERLHSTTGGLEPSLAVDQDGDRAAVDDSNVHHRLEPARGDTDACATDPFDEVFIEGSGDLGRCRL